MVGDPAVGTTLCLAGITPISLCFARIFRISSPGAREYVAAGPRYFPLRLADLTPSRALRGSQGLPADTISIRTCGPLG